MEDWEYGLVLLIQNLNGVAPENMEHDDLIALRTYVGRELTRRELIRRRDKDGGQNTT